MNAPADYDRFASIYNRYWGHGFVDQVVTKLEEVVLADLPSGAAILDLACGTGQLARALCDQGFEVVGVDQSAEMIHHARQNAPDAEFIVADARSFRLPKSFDLVLSTYDSLNHMMNLEELTSVFRSVHAVLKPAGQFLFDLNMEAGYKDRWNGSFSIVKETEVCILQGRYDDQSRIGETDLTIFKQKDGTWVRDDFTLSQRCYKQHDVDSALQTAGLNEVQCIDVNRDWGWSEIGRTFFHSHKPQ